ncbi:hypothetical protein OG909_20490 [Streptomyces sp. NBC_01754]|uniref:hypothetical protein n=1 Tax=Streptomyces sp. NBC_01754 TaxID=2975930 RepID=UPI002DDB5DB7|nr:hypothetical protein [Streptomyces sp. NBC_01754]WSC94460.1 hypothetical protein OG909_20490 [Streptomyces sp. NBC_01754]
MDEALFVRFQGVTRRPQGHFPGVFALANDLARQGLLSEEEHRFWRAGNDWYDAAYPNPSDVDRGVYDPELHPGAVAWFKTTATHLVDRVPGYLDLLAAHGVACERVESSAPGRIVYEDEVQVVVVPWETGPPPAPAGSAGRPDPGTPTT